MMNGVLPYNVQCTVIHCSSWRHNTASHSVLAKLQTYGKTCVFMIHVHCTMIVEDRLTCPWSRILLKTIRLQNSLINKQRSLPDIYINFIIIISTSPSPLPQKCPVTFIGEGRQLPGQQRHDVLLYDTSSDSSEQGAQCFGTRVLKWEYTVLFSTLTRHRHQYANIPVAVTI